MFGSGRRQRARAEPPQPLFRNDGLDDLRKAVLRHQGGGIGGPEPFRLALGLFGPFLGLAIHPEQEDAHLAQHEALGHPLVVVEHPDAALANNPPGQAGFLAGFPRGNLGRPQAPNRPALRNDPATRLAGRQQHDLELPALAHTAGQRCELKLGPDVLFH
jgi:hypothetical protein